MTIGLNEIKNTNTELIKEKTSKKDDNSSLDYSTISSQFANIFTSQVNNQFQNQFDYQKMFTPASSTNFVANTASSLTENNSVSPREYNRNDDYRTEQKSQEYKEEEYKSDETEAKDSADEKPQVKNKEAEIPEINPELLKDKTQKTEKKEQAQAPQTSLIDKEQPQEATAETIKVAIKQTEVQTQTQPQAQAQTKTSAVDNDAKVIVVEKIDLKKKAPAKTEDTKETVQADKPSAQTSSDVVNQKVENIQKQAEMERITANVVEQAPEEVKTAQKLLDGKEKQFSLKADKQAVQDTAKTPDSSMQNQTSNQSFGQNSNSDFSKNFSDQQKQSSQTDLTQNILNNNISFDTSLLKNSISGNMQFGSVLQNTQAASMSERNISEQIMNQIKGNLSSKDSQLTMILKPEKLGKVTLNIINERGALSAEIKTETKEAADALNKNINELKETLEKQGVTCANLVVKVETSDKSQNQMQFSQQNEQQNSKEFSQGNQSNFNQNQESFDNKTQRNTVNGEYGQDNFDIQEQEEMPKETQTASIDTGVVDYRV